MRREGRRAGALAVLSATTLLALTLACGDTRKRPVPPSLDLAFDTAQIIPRKCEGRQFQGFNLPPNHFYKVEPFLFE